MRTSSVYSVLLLAAAPMCSDAHGQIVLPMARPITAKFRADGGQLRQAADTELQWSPLELLRQRVQADMPQAKTFDIMNGCRGTVYEAGNPVSMLHVGSAFQIEWFIQAPHPGVGQFNIVKTATGVAGKIAYEKVATLKHLEPFGTHGGFFSTTATIPKSVSGCEKVGGCALQMHWYSEIANQTYQSCADIVIVSSGGSNDGGSSSRGSSARSAPEGVGDKDDNDSGELDKDTAEDAGWRE